MRHATKFRNELEQVLKLGRIISVAMCHGDQPYVLPFNYGFLNGLIYSHSAKKGFKLIELEHLTGKYERPAKKE